MYPAGVLSFATTLEFVRCGAFVHLRGPVSDRRVF
jgi:hypothetical protein